MKQTKAERQGFQFMQIENPASLLLSQKNYKSIDSMGKYIYNIHSITMHS